MMATLVKESFDSDEWIFEIKWDGFRAIAEVNFTDIYLYSRNNLSFKTRFPTVYESLSRLQMQAVFDGEIVALDKEGKSQFQLIQNYQRTGKGNIVYYVFDLLYYNGHDLTGLPLLQRKELLKKILPNDPTLKYSDHIVKEGNKFFEVVKKKELEGIIAKKIDSTYLPGVRGKDWVKIKTLKQQEVIIAGFTEPRAGRKYFGALVLGVYQKEELVYVGHTGGGFNDKNLEEISTKLKRLVQEKSPFKVIPKTNAPVTWLKPQLVCEVKFQQWTNGGVMRMPVFLGMREDKNAKDVNREMEKPIELILKTKKIKKNKGPFLKSENSDTEKSKKIKESQVVDKNVLINKSSENKKSKINKLIKDEDRSEDGNEAQLKVEGKTLKLTNLKKIYWPEESYTKEDLIEYYNKVSDYILPYLKNRPESLRRNPNGINQQSFFQKDMLSTLPDWIETIKIHSESTNKNINYLVCQDKATLIYMANLGCIEINPWLSSRGSIEFPDYCVIDLDPPNVSFFEDAIDVALAVKEVLDKGNISGFCKTSGSRGIHIYIPLGAKYNYDESVKFAELIATLCHELVPEITSLERIPGKRKNKIYIDYLQNRKGQTLAAPYCLRPKPGATVSTPLEWNELKKGLLPSQFNIQTIFERLQKKGDVFKGVLGAGIDMEKVLEKLNSKEYILT